MFYPHIHLNPFSLIQCSVIIWTQTRAHLCQAPFLYLIHDACTRLNTKNSILISPKPRVCLFFQRLTDFGLRMQNANCTIDRGPGVEMRPSRGEETGLILLSVVEIGRERRTGSTVWLGVRNWGNFTPAIWQRRQMKFRRNLKFEDFGNLKIWDTVCLITERLGKTNISWMPSKGKREEYYHTILINGEFT